MKYYSVKDINKQVRECLEKLIYDYCRTRKYKLVWISVGNEDTQLVLDYPQTKAPVEIIKAMKVVTSKSIREQFSQTLGKQKGFWINSRSQTDARNGYIFVSLNAYDPNALSQKPEIF